MILSELVRCVRTERNESMKEDEKTKVRVCYVFPVGVLFLCLFTPNDFDLF